MFEIISDSMPEDDPGGMKPEEYADVIAHLLRLNRVSDGADGAVHLEGCFEPDPVRKAVAFASLGRRYSRHEL